MPIDGRIPGLIPIDRMLEPGPIGRMLDPGPIGRMLEPGPIDGLIPGLIIPGLGPVKEGGRPGGGGLIGRTPEKPLKRETAIAGAAAACHRGRYDGLGAHHVAN